MRSLMVESRCVRSAGAVMVLSLSLAANAQQAQPVPSKPATEATKAANAALLNELPFNDKADFEDAQRGFIAKPDVLDIKDSKGVSVWNLEPYKQFIGMDKPAPDSIN